MHASRDATIALLPNRTRRASRAGSARILRVIVHKKDERSGRRVGDDDTPYRYPRQYYLLAIFRAVGRRDAPTCAYALTPRVDPRVSRVSSDLDAIVIAVIVIVMPTGIMDNAKVVRVPA